MGMVVVIYNITDVPESKKTPTRLAIYTTHLDPGEELRLPASMVDARLRKLETDGFITIGQLPSWYQASKMKRQGRGQPKDSKELEKLVVKPKKEEKIEFEVTLPTPRPKKQDASEIEPLPRLTKPAEVPAEDKSAEKK